MSDEVIIYGDKFSDLRKEFRELWKNEPLKLNAFIDSGEFALNDFDILLVPQKQHTSIFRGSFHYSPYTKTLYVGDTRNGYEGKVKNMRVITELYSAHKDFLTQDIGISYVDKHAKKKLWESCQAVEKKPSDWICDLAVFFFIFNLVIMNLPNKIKSETSKATRTEQVKKGGSVRYKSVVYLKHTYTLDDKFSLTKSDIKRIIKCPAWGVRGHKRHLRNGTIIYIKPYVKGKYRHEKDKYVSKEYKT